MGIPIGPCPLPPEPPCPALSITASAAGQTSVLVTVVAGGPADISLGGQEALGVVTSHTFTLLTPATTYPVSAVSECGARATAVARTDAEPVVPPDPVYCPSLRLDSGGCGTGGGCCAAEVGFAYRDNAFRDPAATVELPHCNGEVSYAYPAPGMYGVVRAEVPYFDGGAVAVAYLANQSDCAPPVQSCVQVNNTVQPPVNNITLPAPNLVAHSFASDGTLTSTLSNGGQVVSNGIPSNC